MTAAAEFSSVTMAVLAAGPHCTDDPVERAGRTPRPRRIDLMIAATHRIPLYTVNPNDFSALDGLITVVPVTHPDDR
ncbi:hypothetical protein [Nocardia carnea]|uniref:hypothetical protein n=1 Tax=Nocardia carnea TaxID=37328 RepID=UPI0024574E80|nr:hypothetical protein [Nocardia carnea]